MTKEVSLQSRIAYTGDLSILLLQVSNEYGLENYKKHEVIPIGYEDLNLILSTSQGRYFVKIFASFRSERECTRYVNIMYKTQQAGVSHPRLLSASEGFLYRAQRDGVSVYLCVMDVIRGENFFQLKQNPSFKETCFIVSQAALINSLDLKPFLIYDSWSVTNFIKEYKEKKRVLADSDNRLISPLVQSIPDLRVGMLPQCFVHGDIISTNIMRDTSGSIYLIDFAVANYYPRIQELAVLLCDVFYYPGETKKTADMYKLVIDEYEQYISLTDREKNILPQYIQLAHAMHFLRANYEKVVNKNNTPENEYFLKIGRMGLREGLGLK